MTETNAEIKMQKIFEDQYKAFNDKVAEVNKFVTLKTFTPDDESLPTPMEFLEEGMKQFIEEDTATSSTMTETEAEIKMQKIFEDQYKAFNDKVAEVNKFVIQKTFTRAEHDLPTPMEFLEEGMKQFIEEDTATSSTMTETEAEKRMQKIFEDQYKAFNDKVAKVNKFVIPKTFTRAEHDLPTPMQFLEEGMKQFLEEDKATSSKTKTNT